MKCTYHQFGYHRFPWRRSPAAPVAKSHSFRKRPACPTATISAATATTRWCSTGWAWIAPRRLRFSRRFLPYFAFEKWILGKKGGKLDAQAVEKLNAAIRGYNHKDEVRKSILTAAGLEDKGLYKDAVHLNNFDDWTEFHASLK